MNDVEYEIDPVEFVHDITPSLEGEADHLRSAAQMITHVHKFFKKKSALRELEGFSFANVIQPARALSTSSRVMA